MTDPRRRNEIVRTATEPDGAHRTNGEARWGGSGPGSLRAVVASASAGGTIDFSVRCLSMAPVVLPPTLSIAENLTIVGPGAAGLYVSGGGSAQVVDVAPGETVTISGLTIEDGQAPIGVSGGGIDNVGAATLEADIVANGPATDCAGAPPTDGGYNVADDGTCSLSASGASGSLPGEADAAIGRGPLAANGGPTQTQAVGASSVAYHLVPQASCGTADQRGEPRFEPPSATACDAGAFGFAPPEITGSHPSPGPVGASVTLSGYGFTLATTVDVDGTATPFTVVSDTTITFVAPRGSGTVPAEVVNPDGTSNAADVTDAAYPAVTGQPAGRAVAAGQSASFTVACPGVPTPTVQWQVAADGGVFAFGDARFAGSAAGIHPRAPVVGMAANP